MGKVKLTKHGKIAPASETSQQVTLIKIIRLRWPFLLFRTDFAAGMLMSKRMAGRHMQQQKGKSWPDMFFAHPAGRYHGLFLEIKKDRSEVWNQNGTMVASDHIRDQDRVLKHLSGLSYKSEFAFGVDHALEIIETYLSGQS